MAKYCFGPVASHDTASGAKALPGGTEGVGFEPTVRLHGLRFSRRAEIAASFLQIEGFNPPWDRVWDWRLRAWARQQTLCDAKQRVRGVGTHRSLDQRPQHLDEPTFLRSGGLGPEDVKPTGGQTPLGLRDCGVVNTPNASPRPLAEPESPDAAESSKVRAVAPHVGQGVRGVGGPATSSGGGPAPSGPNPWAARPLTVELPFPRGVANQQGGVQYENVADTPHSILGSRRTGLAPDSPSRSRGPRNESDKPFLEAVHYHRGIRATSPQSRGRSFGARRRGEN